MNLIAIHHSSTFCMYSLFVFGTRGRVLDQIISKGLSEVLVIIVICLVITILSLK